ncbi:unnamed protein product [Candidula unifasciata]|uniref:Uncharacterized protein n=1 Tax=Candidula unifasciata TaxID=100452 RepID=A0A8S3ZZE5_9EUPU|nr:unnamed protein product [Candidula unifasciata]
MVSLKLVSLKLVSPKFVSPKFVSPKFVSPTPVVHYKMHKLFNEHCRTTTSCTRRQFEQASMNPLVPAARKLHCIDITDTGRQVLAMYRTMEEIQANTEVWSQYKDRLVYQSCGPQPSSHLEPCQPGANFNFDGFAVRYFKSGIRNRQLNVC